MSAGETFGCDSCRWLGEPCRKHRLITTPADNWQRRLADKWDGEADSYEARRDDDFTVHAMMLRYCAVQLRSGLIAQGSATPDVIADHSECHDLVCSGSRQHPRGAKGVTCSCRGRDTAYSDLREAQAVIADVVKEMRLEAMDRWSDPPSNARMNEWADRLASLLPPEGK